MNVFEFINNNECYVIDNEKIKKLKIKEVIFSDKNINLNEIKEKIKNKNLEDNIKELKKVTNTTGITVFFENYSSIQFLHYFNNKKSDYIDNNFFLSLEEAKEYLIINFLKKLNKNNISLKEINEFVKNNPERIINEF